MSDRFSLLVVLCFAAATGSAQGQGCHAPPLAQDDFVQHFGSPVVVDVLANDVEPDGEALSVVSLSTTCAGTVSEDLGLVTLAPASAGSQDCTISYRARDERGLLSPSATVTITKSVSVFADGFESADTLKWSAQEGS